MVAQFLRFVYKDISGLHEAAYVLAFFAFLSQILGLVRDRMLAHIFGAGADLDIYYAAFRVPDFLYVTIASLVSLSVLIPFFANRVEFGEEKGKGFISHVFTFFGVSILFVSAVAFALMPYIADVLYAGFSAEQRESVVLLSRILLLSPIFLGISNLFGSITQVFRRFFLYALSPLLYNIGIIGGIVFLQPHYGLAGVGIGVVIGAFLHMCIQVPYIWNIGYLPTIRFKGAFTDMVRVITLSLPRTLTLSIHQIVLIVLVGFATTLAEGSISVFTFSFNLQSVPLVIIGVSYSVAAFPTLARLYAQGHFEEYTRQILTATRHIVFWSLPAIVLFIVLRAQIVRTILGSGAFDWTATRLTAATLALLIISLMFQALTLLFVRGYYASGRTWYPLVINAIGSAVMVSSALFFHWLFMNSLLVQYFFESLLKVQGLPGTSILMLAFGYSFGFAVNGLLFYILAQREFPQFNRVVSRVFFQSLSASVIMGFTAYHFLIVFADIFDLSTLLGIFLQGAVSGVLGILAGAIMLYALGSHELREVSKALHTRFLVRGTISPDREQM
ncbi:MAG: murein biosynthesis integral membrane protein MurJ [Candidatus Paceibacterota bacterium]